MTQEPKRGSSCFHDPEKKEILKTPYNDYFIAKFWLTRKVLLIQKFNKTAKIQKKKFIID
jgi:hypothetical protein